MHRPLFTALTAALRSMRKGLMALALPVLVLGAQAAPEAANNAAVAGVLVPLLALGLPTSATAARGRSGRTGSPCPRG